MPDYVAENAESGANDGEAKRIPAADAARHLGIMVLTVRTRFLEGKRDPVIISEITTAFFALVEVRFYHFGCFGWGLAVKVDREKITYNTAFTHCQ